MRRRRIASLVLMALGLIFSAFMPGWEHPALADTCAAAYHQRLQDIREGRGAQLTPVNRWLRSPDPNMSGGWLYAAALFSKKAKAEPKPERICVEEVSKAGRKRCTRWEDKPLETPPAIATMPTDDEMVVFKFLDDYVRAKGAPPEFGSNGRYNWLVARVIGELRGYILQPPNEGLCAGATDLMEFYSSELRTMRRRMEEVQEIEENAREFTLRRVEQAEVFLGEYTKSAPPPGGAQVASAQPMTPVPKQIPPVSTAPARYAGLLERLAKLMLSKEQIAEITRKPNILAALRETRHALDSDTAKEAAVEIREGVLVALRTLEAGVYAETLQARYKAIEDSVFGTIADVRQAHAAVCTCDR